MSFQKHRSRTVVTVYKPRADSFLMKPKCYQQLMFAQYNQYLTTVLLFITALAQAKLTNTVWPSVTILSEAKVPRFFSLVNVNVYYVDDYVGANNLGTHETTAA